MQTRLSLALFVAAQATVVAGQDSTMNCLAPNTDSHGKWTAPRVQGQGYQVNDVIELTCDSGYSPKPADSFGKARITCGNGGNQYPLWIFAGDFPTCVSQNGDGDGTGSTCLTPPQDDHGQWSTNANGYTKGVQVVLQCAQGFSPSTDEGETADAASRMTCGDGGMWEFTGTFAQCTSGNDDIDDPFGTGAAASNCLSPANDLHGQWSYPADGSQAFQPGDQSILTCDSGYIPTAEDGEDMDTASQMSCGSGGLWEFYGSFAICVPKGSSNGAKDDGNGGNGYGDSNGNGDFNGYYEPEVDTSGHKTRTKVQKYTDESLSGGNGWWYFFISLVVLVVGHFVDQNQGGPGLIGRLQACTGGKKVGPAGAENVGTNIYASANETL